LDNFLGKIPEVIIPFSFNRANAPVTMSVAVPKNPSANLDAFVIPIVTY
jgi:hypothetical protein